MRLIRRLRAAAAGLQRAIIRDTAASMLFIRIVEGMAAWLLYNQAYLADSPDPWVVPAALSIYLLVNLWLAYRYRAGDVRLTWVAIDLFANLTTVGVVVHMTGGLASPLLLVFVIKMGGYAFVYGLDIGIVSMVGTLVVAAASSLLSAFNIWKAVPPPILDVDEQFNVGTRLALLALLIISAFSSTAASAGRRRSSAPRPPAPTPPPSRRKLRPSARATPPRSPAR
jgi:hypothetical protein